MNLENDIVYELNMGNMSHCGFDHENMIDYYISDASPFGFLMEKKLDHYFDNLSLYKKKIKIEGDGIKTTIVTDLIDENSNYYDQKTIKFGKGNFTRSKYKGANRGIKNKSDLLEQELWAKNQNFIFTEIENLPIVKVISRSGEWLLKNISNYKIDKSSVGVLWNV